jgi:hypothetical protein
MVALKQSNQNLSQSGTTEDRNTPLDQSSSVIEFPGGKNRRSEISFDEAYTNPLWETRSRIKAIAAKMGVSYLTAKVRGELYRQIDQAFDTEEDVSPVADDDSFMTLMRIILNFQPNTAPFLNISDNGQFIATWFDGANKFRVECFKNDFTHWFISHDEEGSLERSGGESHRLLSLLRQIEPFVKMRWFNPYGNL